MIWVKAFHIIFMVAWFAGLFYLPRLFVNHAMAEEETVRERLTLMEKKLYRFITPWMVLTIGALVAALVAYHFYCGRIIRELADGRNQRSHAWFRWFNELPVLVLFAAVILAVVKPF